MRRRRMILTVASAVTIAAATLAACGVRGKSAPDADVGATTVTIGIAAPVALYALPAIADAEKLWPADVHVRWSVVNPGTVTSMIATGQVQMLITATPQADVAAYTSHAPLGWIAQYQDPADFEMIAAPGIHSAAGLRGKVIAITAPGSSTQYLSQVILHQAGLGPGSYKLLPLGSVPAQVAAFAGGMAQAAVLPSSLAQGLLGQVRGSTVVYDCYARKVPWIGAGILAYLPWARQHPAAAESVLAGLNAALGFLHARPAAAEPIVTKFAPAKTQAADRLQFAYVLDRTPDRLQPVSLASLESVYATIRAAGAGPTSAFARTFIDNTFVGQLPARRFGKDPVRSRAGSA